MRSPLNTALVTLPESSPSPPALRVTASGRSIRDMPSPAEYAASEMSFTGRRRSPILIVPRSAPSRASSVPEIAFAWPMKSATKSVRGWVYMSKGDPICSTLPRFMTMMRSAIVSASFWSCVT